MSVNWLFDSIFERFSSCGVHGRGLTVWGQLINDFQGIDNTFTLRSSGLYFL